MGVEQSQLDQLTLQAEAYGVRALQDNNPANPTVEPDGPTSAFEGDPDDLRMGFADASVNEGQATASRHRNSLPHSMSKCSILYGLNTGCSSMGRLSSKQQRFVDEFLVDLNATQAAIRAGYSPKTAKSIGSENLTKPDIQAYIQERRKEAQKRAELTLDDILAEYKRIAFTGMSKFLRINENNEPEIDLSNCTPEDLDLLTEATTEAFTEGEGIRVVRKVKIKPMDRLKALESLGKHLGLGSKSEDDRMDRMAEAMKEICQRGSAAPISTAHLYRNPDKINQGS